MRTVRAQAADRMLIAGPRHLHAVLDEYAAHYSPDPGTGRGRGRGVCRRCGPRPYPGGAARRSAHPHLRHPDLALCDARDDRAADGATVWLGRDGHTWAVKEEEPLAVRDDRAPDADGTVRNPTPGTLLAVQVTGGERVTSGQPLLIVEEMKIEHTVTAPLDGTIAELTVKAGQQVGSDQPLAIIRASDGEAS